MLLLLSRYLKPLDEVDRWVPEHRAFLDRHYAAGDFLVSGSLVPRTGGVIVTLALDRGRAEAILAEDPFVREGIAAYEIVEMRPTKHHAILASLGERLTGA